MIERRHVPSTNDGVGCVYLKSKMFEGNWNPHGLAHGVAGFQSGLDTSV
ncbi:MAG TPA: hypothetical protein VLC28_12040 [Flavitalea sp.]|nr:hypothetical protein [Flavitalea sp.]